MSVLAGPRTVVQGPAKADVSWRVVLTGHHQREKESCAHYIRRRGMLNHVIYGGQAVPAENESTMIVPKVVPGDIGVILTC